MRGHANRAHETSTAREIAVVSDRVRSGSGLRLLGRPEGCADDPGKALERFVELGPRCRRPAPCRAGRRRSRRRSAATGRMRSPALKRSVSAFETVSTSCALRPVDRADEDDAVAELVAQLLGELAQRRRVGDVDRHAEHLARRRCRARSRACVDAAARRRRRPWRACASSSATSFSSSRSCVDELLDLLGEIGGAGLRERAARARSVAFELRARRRARSARSPPRCGARRPRRRPRSRILKRPMSPSARACVPPQSSTESGVIVSMRTTSPYFSSKIAIAPRFLRLVDGQHLGVHRRVRRAPSSFTRSSIARDLLGA